MDTEILANLENRTNGNSPEKLEAIASEPKVTGVEPFVVRDEGDEEFVYVFDYSKSSPYWNAVEMLKRYIAPGEIVDLGSGAGTLGPPLQEAGFGYIGLERSNGGLRLMNERNLRNYSCDLDDLDNLEKILEENSPIKAFCLMDVLEHLKQPETLLSFLAEYAQNNQTPYLLVSVPNVGHRDVAFNLLCGKWEMTEHGILDKTHLRFYTQTSLLKLLNESGWELVANNNFTLEHSVQYDPDSILHRTTLVGELMHYLSDTLNPDNEVNQFIWLLKPKSKTATTTSDQNILSVKRPLVSILMRTQGLRNELLTEALYSLYAQDCDDYEVLLCFHSPGANVDKLLTYEVSPEAQQSEDEHRPKDPAVVLFWELKALLDKLPFPLRQKIRLTISNGLGRSTPLNDMVEAAQGEYLGILDDDDQLFPNHISAIKRGVEEHGINPIFQTYAAYRQVRVLEEEGEKTSYGKQTPLEPNCPKSTFPYTVELIRPWAVPFNPLTQQYNNNVPVGCFIVPRKLFEQTSLRFRPDFDLAEDWELWMRASQFLKVVTLPEITEVSNIRTNGTNTVGHEELQPGWLLHHRKRLDLQAEHPLVLDGRVARLIYRQHLQDLYKLENIYEAHQHQLKTLQNEKSTWQGSDYRNLENWAKELDARLQKIQGNRLFRLISRFIR